MTVKNSQKISKNITLIFCIVFASCSSNRETKIIDSSQEFFVKSNTILSHTIDPVTDQAGLQKLRKKYLGGDDLEFRVWMLKIDLDCIILKRDDGNWSASAIHQKDYELNKGMIKKIKLSSPKSGWENVWNTLKKENILELPHGKPSLIDGYSYTLEINQKETYWVSRYGNPDHYKTKESVQIIKIAEIIADEFGINNFRTGAEKLKER